MKRLMKVAALVACVGSMLSFSGCGGSSEDSSTSAQPSARKSLSPAEEMAEFVRKINAELAKHGAEPMMSEAEIAERMTKPIEPDDKDLALIRVAFPQLQKYSSVVKEINDLCGKYAVRPMIEKDNMVGAFNEFIGKSNEEREEVVGALQSTLPNLKVYSSVVKEVNDRCEKLGGQPLVGKDDLHKKFMKFILKTSAAQQSDIAEAQDVLKRLKL